MRLNRYGEVRNYGKTVNMKNIFENGWWEDAYPLSYPPGYKLQKLSKESGIFQSLGTINFVFLLKGRVKMRGHLTMHPKYASGYSLFKNWSEIWKRRCSVNFIISLTVIPV